MGKKSKLPIKITYIDGKKCWELGNLRIISTKKTEKKVKRIIYDEFKISNMLKNRNAQTSHKQTDVKIK